MSLDKLDKTRDITHVKTLAHRPRDRETSNNLNTKDVEGARPKVWAPETTNRPDLHHTFDVAGAGPRMLHFELNKPEYNLHNKDIEHSEPCVNKFKSTRAREPSNPLNPVYKLQSFDYVKPEPAKF